MTADANIELQQHKLIVSTAGGWCQGVKRKVGKLAGIIFGLVLGHDTELNMPVGTV